MGKRRPKLRAGRSFECRQHLVSWRLAVVLLTWAALLLVGLQDVVARRVAPSEHQERSRTPQAPADADPMEPCYLANNRASESLTISESTPIGTVVGEILVNGDSSEDGNIELSIRMPGGNNQPASGLSAANSHNAPDRRAVGAQQQHAKANGRSGDLSAEAPFSHRLGSPPPSSSSSASSSLAAAVPLDDTTIAGVDEPTGRLSSPKTARDLSNLIELMPPLSIEQGTKRLILAKKLDRENLDRYIQAGGGGSYQSTSINSLSLTTSASLTVHIKCQLRDVAIKRAPTLEESIGNSSANTATPRQSSNKFTRISKSTNSNSNSIIIPVHLIITDENDNWPTFIASPYIIDLNESAPVGSLLQGNEIVAYDNDQQGPLSTIEYSIVAGSYWSDAFAFLNPLDSRSLVVKSNRLLDFESQPKLMLKVMANDLGDPPNWAITSLYINLLDQDDLNPVFNEDKYYGYIKENRPGDLIELAPKRMIARDGDRSLNIPVSYSFHVKTNQSIHFDLDPDLGRLTLKKTLPERHGDLSRAKEPFCLLVRATQINNPKRWNLAMVSIHTAPSSLQHLSQLSPSNSNSSAALADTESLNTGFRFSQSKYTIEVSEATSVGSTLLTVKINHKYTGVSYQLLDNELGYLMVDEHSGRLTLNRSLDYEMHRQVTVRILATYELFDDNPLATTSYPTLFCDTTKVNVNVINFNEFAPEFSHEQYNFQLSVSELIANFETSKETSIADSTSPDIDEIKRLDMHGRNFARRFGASRASDTSSADESTDEFGYKALRLGQIFCADRDSSDRVSLQLTGSKASMFYLAQDGQLFLPLVNVSLADTSDKMSKRSDSGEKTGNVINNQFVFSRLFAPTMGRRSSSSSSASEESTNTLSRDYLNYLLGEFNNLGRLKLKILARDDGQPDSKQTTALVVITIISIENFILQRAPLAALQVQSIANNLKRDTEPIDLIESSVNDTNQEFNSPGRRQQQQSGQQVMMIPSLNGKSFVQVNSDIITNLLSSGRQQSERNSTLRDSQNKYDQLEFLDAAASSNSIVISGQTATNETTSSAGRAFKPPSLLVIDDEGAKFVAMPAAIEVYNQQVQAGQQSQLARMNRKDQNSKSSHNLRDSSNWFGWLMDRIGLNQHWPSLAGAILIQVVIVVVVASLITRFKLRTPSLFSSRSSYSHQSNIERRQGHFAGRGPSVWTSKFPRFSLPFTGDRSSNNPNTIIGSFDGTPPIVAMLNDSRSSLHADVSYMISSGNASQHSDHKSSATKLSEDLETSEVSLENPQCQSIAASKRDLPISNKSLINQDQSTRQQNLLNHLKSTINRMLDMKQENNSSCIGHVTVKPLDCEIYETYRDRTTIDDRPISSATRLSPVANGEPGKSPSPLSTFVGATSCKLSHIGTRQEERCNSNKTIVSISVTSAPTKSTEAPLAHVNKPQAQENLNSRTSCNKNNSSSNSSVMSLVSLSSSISNKISAAVDKSVKEHRLATSTSDVSSIDSATLFNRVDGLVDASSQTTNICKSYPKTNAYAKPPCATPPKPPPLPPPPSLVQVRHDGITLAAASPALTSAARNSSNDKRSAKFTCNHSNQNRSHNSSLSIYQQSDVNSNPTASHLSAKQRRATPQNPAHVKLRREALAEKVNYATNDGHTAPISGQRAQLSTGRLFERKNGGIASAVSTGGRREARQAQTAPPTPPPMPPPALSQLRKLAITGPSSAKTVSPTTSVDRGYESFQSYNSSSHAQQPRSQPKEVSHFNSPRNHDAGCRENRAPVSSTHRQIAAQSKLNYQHNQANSKRTNEDQIVQLTDTALDDEDFYYCSGNINGSCKEESMNPISVSNLLSEYASHTYKHPVDSAIDGPTKQRKLVTSARSAGKKHTCYRSNHEQASRASKVHDREPYQDFAVPSMNIVYDEQVDGLPAEHYTGRASQVPRRGDNALPRRHQHLRTSQPVAGNAFVAGLSQVGNKKQLTWSDQVETNY